MCSSVLSSAVTSSLCSGTPPSIVPEITGESFPLFRVLPPLSCKYFYLSPLCCPPLVPLLPLLFQVIGSFQKTWKLGFLAGRQRNSIREQLPVMTSSSSSSLDSGGDESPQSPPLSMMPRRFSSLSKLRSFGITDKFSPKGEKDDDCTVSSIEKIEQRTKASIDKLKHILYKVKTQPGDGSLYSIIKGSLPKLTRGSSAANMNNMQSGRNTNNKNKKLGGQELPPSQPSRVELRVQRLRDMGLLEENSQNSESGDAASEEQLFPEAFVQYDALTSTTTTVKLHKGTNSATVTVVASVRDPADEDMSHVPVEKSVILAARALARSASALEEKANALTLASKVRNTSVEDSAPDKTVPAHEKLVSQLEKSKIVEGTQVRKGYYAGTPFRPVYKVSLEQADGSITEALLKPATPGDVHCRWGNASSDWVAYQVGRLLGTDMVPPAAMHRDVKVGEKTFPLATLMHYVPHVKPLTRLSLQEWGGELPAVFVSNAHILDALLGSCPRARNMFMEGPSWTQAGARQAMLLDHPMGPGQGKLHPMWTQRGQICGIKCVSGSTLTRLRSLNKSVLMAAMGKWVSTTEIDNIVERLAQVLAYFDAMAQHGNRSLTVV